MNISLYAAATGMDAQQQNLSVIANNIANVNTTGFKGSKMEFQDLLYQENRPTGGEAGNGETAPAGIELGHGTRVVTTAKVFTQGQLKQTGEKLDIAIDGVGFLPVDNIDGATVYTRDGAMKIGPTGNLVTSDGLALTGLGQVPTETTGITIANNGQITFHNADGTSTAGPQIQLGRFPNPSGLKSLGGNLYVETDASGAAELGNPGENGFGTIVQGFLEMSNVNVVQEMVNMIIAQRAYEINSKAIQTSDQMLEQMNQLKR